MLATHRDSWVAKLNCRKNGANMDVRIDAQDVRSEL